MVNFLLPLLDASVIANHYRIDPAARIPTLRFRTSARRPSPVLAASRQQPAANPITSAPIMASIFRRIYDWLLRLFWCVCLLPCACPCHPSMPVEPLISVHSCPFHPSKRTLHAPNMTQEACSLSSNCRATEMDITMIGLQNAGKTSLLRVLAVSSSQIGKQPRCIHENPVNTSG